MKTVPFDESARDVWHDASVEVPDDGRNVYAIGRLGGCGIHWRIANNSCWSTSYDVREWCVSAGKDSRLRIALCGYEGEHDSLESLGWRVHAWKTTGGMSGIAKSATHGQANTARERIWFSPACLDGEPEGGLFAGGGS